MKHSSFPKNVDLRAQQYVPFIAFKFTLGCILQPSLLLFSFFSALQVRIHLYFREKKASVYLLLKFSSVIFNCLITKLFKLAHFARRYRFLYWVLRGCAGNWSTKHPKGGSLEYLRIIRAIKHTLQKEI